MYLGCLYQHLMHNKKAPMPKPLNLPAAFLFSRFHSLALFFRVSTGVNLMLKLMALPTWTTGVSSCLNTSQLLFIQLVHFETAALSKAKHTHITHTQASSRNPERAYMSTWATSHQCRHKHTQTSKMSPHHTQDSTLHGCFAFKTEPKYFMCVNQHHTDTHTRAVHSGKRFKIRDSYTLVTQTNQQNKQKNTYGACKDNSGRFTQNLKQWVELRQKQVSHF